MCHAATITTGMSLSQITSSCFNDKIKGRRERALDAVRAVAPPSTTWARRERAVDRQLELRGNAIALRGDSVETP